MQPNYRNGFNTKAFMTIFPNYLKFKEVYADSPLFNDGQTWIGPAESTFRLIFNHYADSHVAYTEDGFKRQFENVLYEHYEKFEFDCDIKKDSRKLSDADWSNDGATVMTNATAPTQEGTTNSEELDSLDNLTKSKNVSGVASVISKKKYANQAYAIKTFLRNFSKLFVSIYEKQATPVWISDGEGYLEEEDQDGSVY